MSRCLGHDAGNRASSAPVACGAQVATSAARGVRQARNGRICFTVGMLGRTPCYRLRIYMKSSLCLTEGMHASAPGIAYRHHSLARLIDANNPHPHPPTPTHTHHVYERARAYARTHAHTHTHMQQGATRGARVSRKPWGPCSRGKSQHYKLPPQTL